MGSIADARSMKRVHSLKNRRSGRALRGVSNEQILTILVLSLLAIGIIAASWSKIVAWFAATTIYLALGSKSYVVPILSSILMAAVSGLATLAFRWRRGAAASAPRTWDRVRWTTRRSFIVHYLLIFVAINLFLPNIFTQVVDTALTNIIAGDGATSAFWYLAVSHVGIPGVAYVAVKKKWF